MNRSLKLSMLMALALGSSQALAVDLGQIQVKSALGQPLLAEIPLHPASPSELKNLTVQLASSEDFARAGISGGRTSIPLQFSVASNGSGGQVIRITSSVNVDDPYLDLLLEVNGGGSKSVREFTILLDPPTTNAAAPSAAQTRVARRSEPVTSRRSAVTPSATAPAPARHATHAATAANGQYGPVQSGQTLSAIARDIAPSGVDVHQMLVALKQANPDAFYRDNINALKSGAVLRVPTATEAQAMDVAAAAAEVQRQNSDWRAGTTSKPGVVADAGTRSTASSSPTGKASTGDRLALVPAKEGNSSGTQGNTAGAKGDKSSAAAVRQDLLRTQESLASLLQQTTDLKTRLKDLTDINGKNERLLSLKDNEIAELQAKLAAARKNAGMPPAAPIESKPAVAASTPSTAMLPAHASTVATASTAAKAMTSPVVSTPVASSTSASTLAMNKPASSASAPATASTALTKPVVTPVKTAAAPFKPTKHIAPPVIAEDPWYLQTWAWAAGAVVIVLLILAGMLGRRRRPVAAAAGTSSLADRFGTEPVEHHLGDDVDQEELLDQLAEHPDDIGLHLELVTLYYSRRDVEHFEAAAEAMHAHITDPQQDEWQDVVHMGEDLVPGHPLFDHHAEMPLSEENEARRAFDIDDYAGQDEAASSPPAMPPLPTAAPKKVSEYNFNFDLTSGVHGSSAGDKAEAAASSAAHDAPAEPASNWQFDEPGLPTADNAINEFSDDPVDTKLDLARAYLDMGDADGARAMLGEVVKEGSQMQQDVAKRLLESMH